MTIGEPRKDSPDHTVELDIPHEVWVQIPERFRRSEEDACDYLLNAVNIGILAMKNAGLTIDTSELQSMVERTAEQTLSQQSEINEQLEQFVNSTLTGDDSLLARRLKETLGTNGMLEQLINDLLENLTDPDRATSIPAKTSQVLLDQANTVMDTLNAATDITDETTNLGKFVRDQRTRVGDIQTMMTEAMTKMGEQIDARMKRIEDALNVDEALQARADEIEELKDKSSHKGIHFENDAVDALQDTADVLGDRIEHTGGSGEGASRSKVGDIVIVIQHQGVPEMRIAIEAKAGSISRKKLIEQVRNGVTNRNAVRGIGLMDRKHMGKTQHVLGQEGENYIIGVDWAEDDFLALEVTYRMLRSVMIAEALRMDGTDTIDVDAIQKRLEQAKIDLGMLQSMKTQTSTAIGTLEGVRSNMDLMEKKVRAQLSEAEDLLRDEE